MATSLQDITALNQFPSTEKLFKSIPATPKGLLGPAETGASDVEMMQAKNIARENVGKAEVNIERAKRTEKTSELAGQADLEKQFAERRKNLPELAELKTGEEKLGSMAFIPTKDTATDIASLYSLVNVIGMAMGGGGKQNAMQAMYAMNGMLEGYQKGKADLYKKEKESFDKNFKSMQTAVSTLKDRYSRALEIEKLDKEAGRIEKALALSQAGSPVLKAMEDKQGSIRVMETINDLDKAAKNMVTQYNAIKLKADADAAAERRHKENIANANTRARLQRESQERIAKEKQDKKPGLPKKGEFQADYISEIIGKRVDVDAASKAAAAADYKVKIKELADKNAELGGAPGLKVEFSNYINKFLNTKAGPTGTFTRTDLDEAYINLTNEQSFRSLSEKSKVMAKSELDAVMAYLQVKYGNRAPVAEFRAAQTVLNRGNMTASAYNQVLSAQVRDTNDRLLGLGFKPQDILKIDNFFSKNREQLDLLSVGGQQEETQQSETDSVTGLPLNNENGWVLESDGKGGYAYVNPSNRAEYTEVE
jgi:hypothetical protein